MVGRRSVQFLLSGLAVVTQATKIETRTLPFFFYFLV